MIYIKPIAPQGNLERQHRHRAPPATQRPADWPLFRLKRENREHLMMREIDIGKAFTLMEPGPVVLVTTNNGEKNNVMTLSWTMVMDFTPVFAITTGPWNYSYTALRDTRECTISIPTVDMIDQVVGVGTCSGVDTDKFATFGLTPVDGKHVRAPLIKECLANIECKVIDIIQKHNIVVLEGIAAYVDSARKEKRTIHAVGDGTFVIDGRKLNRRKMMQSKIPEGV
ncbi:flavin reductase family protein [Pseudomonas laurentiana]|uniref:flavin reductase family protein n=1 Tax=Pseudomonas laurentiana TaxID=2364649 RepID=UPI001E648948|nr:flavin reductase family protein [Pseudomonas laurentiana]